MPAYFFHVTDAAGSSVDEEGLELRDLAAARRCALDSAGDLVAEAVKSGERDYEGRIDVADDRGATVLTIAFACPVRIAP